MGINRLAGRRAQAYALDCLGYAAIAAAEVPVGLLVRSTGHQGNHPLILALSAVPPSVATLVAARAESGPRAATWGKRRLGLAVESRSDPPGFGRALARNIVKIFIPWNLGHLVAFGGVWGGFERNESWAWGSLVATYGLAGLTVALGVLGPGRALHDRIADTQVV